jgi:pimeloyl-ACP methyl ester carboxylesterase
MHLAVALSSALALAAPGEYPLHFGTVQLPTGVRLSYAEQGNPRGHPVILLHGYGDSWYSFSPVLPLIDQKYHVYALDLRGHGESDRPPGGYTMRDLGADVVAFMDDRRLARVTVVGHSMGSFVAQQLALSAPERIARLVLIGSGTTPRQILGMAELDRTVQSLRDPVPLEFVREFQASTVYQPVDGAFMDRVVAESAKLPARVWQGLMAGMLATDPAVGLSGQRIPTAIFWGDQDGTFSWGEQDALVQAIAGAEFVVYPETGHALHWERPDRFVRDLHGFLERTTSY